MARLTVGFITYGKVTAKYLPFFLPSLMVQTCKDFKILVIDNTEEKNNKNEEYVRNNYPNIDFQWSGKNFGFAKAYNKMINKAIEMGAEYFLALNPDMVFESDMIAKLMAEIEKGENIGAVMPKILRWDFENNKKTDIIDSLGLKVDSMHRFFDDKQGEIDDNKLKTAREIFGFTGAAVLLNLNALKDTAFKNEFFDELMFMYKEDCDLSYRLRLAGYKILLIPLAVAYHNRRASGAGGKFWQIFKNRKNKSRQIKKWAFLNQWILLWKFRRIPYNSKIRIKTCAYQLVSIIFILIFESYLLKEFINLWRMRKNIAERRDLLKIRVTAREMERFIN